MASVAKDAVIDATPAHWWEAIRDFSALSERLVPGFVTRAEMVGPREREVTFFNGAVAREYMVGADDERMRLAYTIVDSPMDSSHHNASVQVITEGDSRCRVVWSTDVLPDELAERSEQMMEEGIRVLKSTLEATG